MLQDDLTAEAAGPTIHSGRLQMLTSPRQILNTTVDSTVNPERSIRYFAEKLNSFMGRVYTRQGWARGQLSSFRLTNNRKDNRNSVVFLFLMVMQRSLTNS